MTTLTIHPEFDKLIYPVGDEDGGVALYCRDCRGDNLVAVFGEHHGYKEPVTEAHTMAALIEAANAHLREHHDMGDVRGV